MEGRTLRRVAEARAGVGSGEPRLRVLVAFVGGRGHLDPLVPIARAAVAAGHRVRFSSGSAMAASVRAAGFDLLPLPADEPPPVDDDGPPAPLPLQPIDRAREIKAAISHASLVELPNAGHMPMLEAPQETAEALKKLI